MDAGYDWRTGRYEMREQTFNADYYTTQTEFQLASYPTVCLMLGVRNRNRLAGSFARAMKRCVSDRPEAKPDYRTVKGMVLADPELKGFISVLLLNIVLGLITKVIVDWIWNNWTAEPQS